MEKLPSLSLDMMSVGFSIGLVSNLVTRLIHLKSAQNLFVPSFFLSSTIAELQSDMTGSMISASSIA